MKEVLRPTDEKEEELINVDFVDLVDNSTISTCSRLYIRGASPASIGKFKLAAQALCLKQGELFDLIVEEFISKNKNIKKISEFSLRNEEADRILKETKELMEKHVPCGNDGEFTKKAMSKKALDYRINHMLKPFLKDPSVPDVQKHEIIEFIEGLE